MTEASYLIERLVQNAAYELGMDPVDFRKQNFIQARAVPVHLGDGVRVRLRRLRGGDGPVPRDDGLHGHARRAARSPAKRGGCIGVGIASFTEVVGAGKGKEYDIAGLRMFDSAELRLHPTGKAILKLGTKSQGQGHETTYGQIIASQLGIQPEDVLVEEGDTDTTPYGLGTYASRSDADLGCRGGHHRPQAPREGTADRRAPAGVLAGRPRMGQADRFHVKGAPDRVKTIQECIFAAYTNLPDGMEPGLEGVHYYDPPNMTFPFGTYGVVVEIDRGTGEWKVHRMVAVDDCGVRINPMIVEGQITGGLTEGYAIAAMELIDFDEDGNCIGSNFMDYLIPTSWETPAFDLGETVTPSPHHPIGAKGVGESATVGSPAAYVNAVIDALQHAGVRNIDMPVTSSKVWEALNEAGLAQ